MNSEEQQNVLELLLWKKRRLLRAVSHLQILATAVVFATMALAFANPQTPTTVFISLFAFLLVQVFATRDYAALGTITRQIRLVQHGPYFSQPVKLRWTIPAGVAVKDGYFLLLLAFDISWLSHAYLYPSPADSFGQFLRQLAIGPISGTAFVVFTVVLWLFYAWLYVIGSLYTREINSIENLSNIFKSDETNMREIWMRVEISKDDELFLQGHRFATPGQQPIILFPGFHQNGYVYHLTEGSSLAHYLWQNGFDVWIIHPRGTALSDGRKRKSSLDDFACTDIPAVINHVFSKTGIKPVFVGHSQGGISAIIGLMGTVKSNAKTVLLSGEVAAQRQDTLKGLVTLGSFLDFSFSKSSWLKSFVQDGVCIKIGQRKRRLIASETILKLATKFTYLGPPLSFSLRMVLLQSKKLRTVLFPLALVFDFIASLPLWEFLYHIPNVRGNARKALFYKTMDGTYSGILQQFQHAVATSSMCSLDESINYSNKYHLLKLPVSVVAMEYDSLADPAMMKKSMFDHLGSAEKYFTEWKGVGHEDHFTDAVYFPQVLAAIKRVC